MSCPYRLTALMAIHLGPLKSKDPKWEIREPSIAGHGLFATQDLKRGDVIFRDKALLMGPEANHEEVLNMCSVCLQILEETRFMCRRGCGLPVCELCGKKKQHRDECEMFRRWKPREPNVADSSVIRLLTVARALLMTREQQELINSLQANLDNNHRTEIRLASSRFNNFPKDKDSESLINQTVAVLRTNGFDAAIREKTTDNEEFPHRALFPLFGLLNHDCVPNTTYTFEQKAGKYILVVRAAKDIPEGTELTTTYTKLFSNNFARYLFLKMKKKFICKCERCSDPTEKGTFISGLYCRNIDCQGLVVPEITKQPQPNWTCLECKEKSNHLQMLKSEDFAYGALKVKLEAESLQTVIDYINEKCGSFIPSSNYIVINAKLQVIAKLSKTRDLYDEEVFKNKERYCNDILEILDKLGVGDCLMRAFLDRERAY